MRTGSIAIVVAALALAAAGRAGAAEAPRRLAVLTPNASWGPDCADPALRRAPELEPRCSVLDAIAEAARGGAVTALRGRPWKVMTREEIAIILEGNPACGDAKCDLDAAQLVAADAVVTGSVRLIETTWVARLEVFEVRSSALMDSAEWKGATQLELVERASATAEELVRKALGIGGGAVKGLPATAGGLPGAAGCPQGLRDVGGHCCWPGQDWGAGTGQCLGVPACPDGFRPNGDGCEVGCPANRIFAGGHCCWPGQDWAIGAERCVGQPACPEGWNRLGESCLPAGMAPIPGGSFKPAHRREPVTIAPFQLDVTEVTVEAFGACVKAGRCTGSTEERAEGAKLGALPSRWCNWGRPDRARHPINCVSWEDARDYCAWAGKRLPSEEEWEWAARGADWAGRYPWGNDDPRTQLCWDGTYVGRKAKGLGTCEVGSFPDGRTRHDVLDLGGNVWEWTASAYDETKRVFRGGGWNVGDSEQLEVGFRARGRPTTRFGIIGFRCARTP